MGRTHKFGARPGPRKINGKTFRWNGWSHTKKKAKERANELRKDGFLVRIIKDKPSKTLTAAYNLYVRKK